MNSLRKILTVGFLLALLFLQVGCATTESDLDYSRKTIDASQTDNSYHGWAAPPQEKSQ